MYVIFESQFKIHPKKECFWWSWFLNTKRWQKYMTSSQHSRQSKATRKIRCQGSNFLHNKSAGAVWVWVWLSWWRLKRLPLTNGDGRLVPNELNSLNLCRKRSDLSWLMLKKNSCGWLAARKSPKWGGGGLGGGVISELQNSHRRRDETRRSQTHTRESEKWEWWIRDSVNG